MKSLPEGSRILLVVGITDMRNVFNGLASKVQNVLKNGAPVHLPWTSGRLDKGAGAVG